MKSLILLFSVLFTSLAWGHGEEKPGPNKGFIRMPGAFHTEVVMVASHQLKVYLLDANFENPSVKGAELNLTYMGKERVKASCEIEDELYYLCTFPKKVNLSKKGKLVLDSQREGQKGRRVSYELPLRHESAHGEH